MHSIAMRQRRKQDLFANTPPEIITDILSRLPVRTVISCKCVCKSWFALIQTREFVDLHLHKATPALSVCSFMPKFSEIFEFEDGLDLESHELHYKSVTKFNFPYKGWVFGSANGLFCICNMSKNNIFYICNPITRDYIELDCPIEFIFTTFDEEAPAYGFGVTKITGQYKVIWILQEHPSVRPKPKNECYVYTIGTGSWRIISPNVHLAYRSYSAGAFLNGNLHWLVSTFQFSPQLLISCFDIETEQFSTFASPLLTTSFTFEPNILGDCLCLCDNRVVAGIDIWLMKEYGVETSWTKQFFIGNVRPWDDEVLDYNVISLFKVFKDGDIVLAWNNELFFYSKKNNIVHNVELFEPCNVIDAFFYTPSFLSLKSFGRENVSSF